jgi:hypothetical protein
MIMPGIRSRVIKKSETFWKFELAGSRPGSPGDLGKSY